MNENDSHNGAEPTDGYDMRRRAVLGAAVSATALGLAGCAESDDTNEAGGGASQDTDEPTDEPTATEAETTAEPTDEPTATEQATASEADAPDITIHEHELVEGPMGDAEVAGEVSNTSGEEQDYIQVDARFYDSDGTRIGESMWNAEDVAVDERLKFETVMSTTDPDDVADYELKAGTSPF